MNKDMNEIFKSTGKNVEMISMNMSFLYINSKKKGEENR